MSLPFDATLKDILAQSPGELQGPFALPDIEPALPLNVDLSTLSAATDLALGYGDPLQEIIDLDFQSGPDLDLPARLHLYNAALHLKFRVPVRSMVVLLRPKADSANLNGKLSYHHGKQQVLFHYDVIRMWKKPVEEFLTGGLNLLPLATLCKLPKGKPVAASLRELIQEVDRRLAQHPEHAKAVRLMTAAFILTGLRVAKESLAEIFEGVKIMHESSAYDMWVEESEAKGQIKGRDSLVDDTGPANDSVHQLRQGQRQGAAQEIRSRISSGSSVWAKQFFPPNLGVNSWRRNRSSKSSLNIWRSFGKLKVLVLQNCSFRTIGLSEQERRIREVLHRNRQRQRWLDEGDPRTAQGDPAGIAEGDRRRSEVGQESCAKRGKNQQYRVRKKIPYPIFMRRWIILDMH